jgi:hypothetical protein
MLAYGRRKGSCKLLIGKRIFSSYPKEVRTTISQEGVMFWCIGVLTDCVTTLAICFAGRIRRS